MLKKLLLIIILLSTSSLYAAPHFFIQMENRSAKPITVSFKPNIGKVSLEPVLMDHTPLSVHELSNKYGVIFEPLTTKDMFDIVFTGQKDCIFTIAYFAPGIPKVTVKGLGCYGGGYEIIDSGYTLLLYVSDIHYAKHSH